MDSADCAENYIHTDKAQGIIKYMRNTPVKFVAIMPNEDTSLESYISLPKPNLDAATLLVRNHVRKCDKRVRMAKQDTML